MRCIDPTKVGIYIRWSTEDQGQGHTLSIQTEACRHYCLSQGWVVQESFIYIDDGWSGSTLERPALARLRADVVTGNVVAVVVYKLDRLSRNIKDVIALVLDEWESRCIVRSTMEPIDTASDTGKLTFTLLSSFADFERGTIRARTLSGKKKNAEQGRNAGSPYPYAYQRGEEAGIYRIVEPEAAVVRQVFALYLSGLGCKAIAERLNEMGALNRTEGPGRRRLSPGKWSNTAVLRILRNPVYTGQLVYGRTVRNPRHGKEGERYYLKGEPSAVIRVPSPHIPPIIDADAFAAAEQIRRAKQSPHFGRRAVGSPHLLSGMMWCTCGHTVGGRQCAARSARYYCCSGHKNKGAAVCQAGQLPADLLDQLVLERLHVVYGRASADLSDNWQATVAQQRQMLRQLCDTATGELTQVRQAQQRLTFDYTAGAVTGEAYQHMFATLAERARQRAINAQTLCQQLAEREKEWAMNAAGAPSVVSFRDSFGALTDSMKKLLLKHLIHRIVVYRAMGSRQIDLHIEWTGVDPKNSARLEKSVAVIP